MPVLWIGKTWQRYSRVVWVCVVSQTREWIAVGKQQYIRIHVIKTDWHTRTHPYFRRNDDDCELGSIAAHRNDTDLKFELALHARTIRDGSSVFCAWKSWNIRIPMPFMGNRIHNNSTVPYFVSMRFLSFCHLSFTFCIGSVPISNARTNELNRE